MQREESGLYRSGRTAWKPSLQGNTDRSWHGGSGSTRTGSYKETLDNYDTYFIRLNRHEGTKPYAYSMIHTSLQIAAAPPQQEATP